MTTRSEIKITIAKLIEIAYSRNKGVTTKFLRKKGNFKLTIDQNGKVMIHGGAGPLTFNGATALEGLGVKIKMASINFTKIDDDDINYKGTFSFAGGAGAISLSGSFNIEELITSCSGILCRAARLLKGRHQAYDAELQRIMGR
jgi:hypothetical protein